MSKKTIALALAIVFVFAFATSAFAVWGDSTYAASALAGGTGTTNPHGPYDTTSRKCAVCHAVHNADPTGTRLLRGGGTSPCVICHVSTDAGIQIVYEGQTTAYSTASEYAHNNDCGNCHTVHGVGSVAIGTTLNLKRLPAMAYTSASIDDPALDRSGYAAYSVSSLSGSPTMSQWCSACHPYYNEALNGRTHVMTASGGNLADYATTSGNMQVAWTDTNTCMDCHDSNAATLADRAVVAPAVISSLKFPHYTNGARFLNTQGGTAVASGQAGLDGVCLKCHEDAPAATAGVGTTY